MKVCLTVMAIIVLLVAPPAALAGDVIDSVKQGMGKRQEGAKDIVTSPGHVAKGTAEGAETEKPVSGAVAGAAEGTGKAAKQAVQGAGGIVEGTGDIIMAPVKAVTN